MPQSAKPFELARGSLATPEGLFDACESSRSWVEANLPGPHLVGQGTFFSLRGSQLTCHCAASFLLAALAGSCGAATGIAGIEVYSAGLPDAYAFAAFILGFDEKPLKEPMVEYLVWYEAGHRLWCKWSGKKC